MKRSEFIKNVLALGAVIGIAPKVMAEPNTSARKPYLPEYPKFEPLSQHPWDHTI